MPVASISKFKGLDVRRLREASDARSARVARNVDLTIGEEYTARDGLRWLMRVNPQSKGLYAVGGTLRAIIPGGQDLPLEEVGPVRVKYDHIGLGDSYFGSVMVGMSNTDQAVLEGDTWPAGSVGASLAVNGDLFNIIAVSGNTATLDSPFTGTPGLYTFLLSGTASLASRTCSMAGSSDIVTLTNGVWPFGLEGRDFSITRASFTAKVVSRLSNTQLKLDTSLPSGALTNVEFQVGGVAQPYPLNTITRITGVEAVGANASFGVYPYLVIERWVDPTDQALGKLYEHHWIQQDAIDPTVVLATQVRLPFTPGASILQMGGKVLAPDDTNGVVRFCSTVNGPSDWTTPNDAGFIPVLTHTSGDRRIRGLGTYDDKCAVIFSDAVQLWALDPQPSNITLSRVINGPGTEHPNSVVNVLGDLFYFTRGGFRSLHMFTITGQIQEQDDIGAPIDLLTRDEAGEAAVALWSQVRGQYLCAFGSTVYAFRYSPKTKVKGWTTWDLGTPVDAVAELNGKTYVRSGDDIYVLERGYNDGSTWEVTFNDFTAGDPAPRKRADFLEVVQRGTCQVRVFLEPDSDDYYLDGPTLEGTTIKTNRVFLGALSRVFGFRFTGQGPWTLSALQVSFLKLPW